MKKKESKGAAGKGYQIPVDEDDNDYDDDEFEKDFQAEQRRKKAALESQASKECMN